MSERQPPISRTEAQSFPAGSSALLQRECACGGSAGLDDQCEGCRQAKLIGQAALIQPKLRIGPADDHYERQADRVADTVMRTPSAGAPGFSIERITPLVQRQPIEDEEEAQTKRLQRQPVEEDEEELQTKRIQRQPVEEEDEEELQTKRLQRQPVEEEEEEEEVQTSQLQRQPLEEDEEEMQMKRAPGGRTAARTRLAGTHHGGGQPLPATEREFFEPRLGFDFSHVRIHTGSGAASSARSVGAKAYTVGRNVVFGSGQWAPGTDAGRRLIAHELTHVVQQQGDRLEKTEKTHATLQRRLLLHSTKDASAFKWFFSANDAKNFYWTRKRGQSPEVKIHPAKKRTKRVEDAFRFGIVKKIIQDKAETLLVRGYKLDAKVAPHDYFKFGKKEKTNLRTTLRQMAGNILGAGGVTIPSKQRLFAVNPKKTGVATSVPNQTWVFYSTPTSLAHEFGHAYLLFAGSAFKHGEKVSAKSGIKDPSGKGFSGDVNVFIREFVQQRYAELVLFDPKALHFSPTLVHKWPEPPDFKPTFVGTWLEFTKKYPGAKAGQTKVKHRGRWVRKLKICVPQKGQICP